MSDQDSELTAEKFDEQLRADDRISVVESDLDPDDPRMGSAQWWVTADLMDAKAVLDLLPEPGKGVVREGNNVILSLPP